MAHVVLACAVVESSSQKTRKITYLSKFAWLGTREDATRHPQQLIFNLVGSNNKTTVCPHQASARLFF